MTKCRKSLFIILGICLIVGIAAAVLLINSKSDAPAEKHLILNADGSYGGTLDAKLYGEGAPLNGEYDVINSDYYTVSNDYYNMASTEERILIPKFSSYQQTMQDSSGLACLMMLLNYAGEDVKNTYTELALVKRYEELNNTQVYGNGTTAEGLINLINDLNLGYTAENESFIDPGDLSSSAKNQMKTFFNDCLKEGKFVFVRYQSPVGYGWKLVIGYDTLGNIKSTVTEKESDSTGDDVMIFAEPYDGFDHYQDGYATERALDFFAWWKNMSIDGTINETTSYLVVDPNLEIDFNYQKVDNSTKQKLYKIHLPRNPDGTYGGTRDEKLYGTISSGRGWFNHTNSNYYKINDFYNMGSEGSRVLLKNYTVLQQTMSASCGICAVTSVLKYYGEEATHYDMELLYHDDYLEVTNTTKLKGSIVAGHNSTLKKWGYESEFSFSPMGKTSKYDTYEAYMQFMRSNLEAGRPIVVSTYLGSGHFVTVIGLDDMGTDYIYDDVIITADSADYWDGYQDGYVTYPATKFFAQHTTDDHMQRQSLIVVFDKD